MPLVGMEEAGLRPLLHHHAPRHSARCRAPGRRLEMRQGGRVWAEEERALPAAGRLPKEGAAVTTGQGAGAAATTSPRRDVGHVATAELEKMVSIVGAAHPHTSKSQRRKKWQTRIFLEKCIKYESNQPPYAFLHQKFCERILGSIEAERTVLDFSSCCYGTFRENFNIQLPIT
jgi:tryptophan 2,3-dioxygenase